MFGTHKMSEVLQVDIARTRWGVLSLCYTGSEKEICHFCETEETRSSLESAHNPRFMTLAEYADGPLREVVLLRLCRIAESRLNSQEDCKVASSARNSLQRFSVHPQVIYDTNCHRLFPPRHRGSHRKRWFPRQSTSYCYWSRQKQKMQFDILLLFEKCSRSVLPSPT